MTTTDKFTPRSVRDIVDAGDNPLDHLAAFGDDADFVVDELQRATRVPVIGRAAEAERIRAQLDWMLANRTGGIPRPDGSPIHEGEEGDEDGSSFARIVTAWQWHLELLEDPSLIEKVARLLPPRDAYRALHEIELARSPHPLRLQLLEQWSSCDGCGLAMSPGTKALQIGVQPNYSEDDDIEALVWCTGCLGRVAALVNPEVEG